MVERITLAATSCLVTHAPLRLQRLVHGCLGEDGVTRQATHATSAAADGAELGSRDTAVVTPDTTSIAHCVRILELARRSKVQGGEGSRLAQQMSMHTVS